MGSIISKIADEIKIHGTYEKYVAFRDRDEDIPYFPDPEEVPRVPDVVLPKYVYFASSSDIHYPAESMHKWAENNIINGLNDAAKSIEDFNKMINAALGINYK